MKQSCPQQLSPQPADAKHGRMASFMWMSLSRQFVQKDQNLGLSGVPSFAARGKLLSCPQLGNHKGHCECCNALPSSSLADNSGNCCSRNSAHHRGPGVLSLVGAQSFSLCSVLAAYLQDLCWLLVLACTTIVCITLDAGVSLLLHAAGDQPAELNLHNTCSPAVGNLPAYKPWMKGAFPVLL